MLERRILRPVLKSERFVPISFRRPARRFQTSAAFRRSSSRQAIAHQRHAQKRGGPASGAALESRELVASLLRALRVAGVCYPSLGAESCRKATGSADNGICHDCAPVDTVGVRCHRRGVLYRLARPALFTLDPERAHRLAVAAVRAMPRRPAPLGGLLETEVAGLTFPNPLGMAAG